MKTWMILSTLLLGLCAMTGRLRPHMVPDSASYIDFSFADATSIASNIRPPGYPGLLRLVRLGTLNGNWALQGVVVCQILLHAFASSCVYLELSRWSCTRWVSWSTAIAVGVGCTFWDHVNTVATDAPAMSIGILVAMMVMRVWRTGSTWVTIGAISLGCLVAVSLRPAALWLIPWACLMMLIRPANAIAMVWPNRFLDSAKVCSLTSIVLLAWCGFRYQAVGDFSLLPFGHANLAGVTTQLLDQRELESLPGPLGELGAAIAKRRIDLSGGIPSTETSPHRDGPELRPVTDPANRAPNTMAIEERWDAMTYLVVIPEASRRCSGTVAENRLLGELNREIIRRYPARYLRWWLLAIRRGVWGSLANIAMHPIFLSILGAASILSVVRFTQAPNGPPVQTPDLQALGLIAITYAAANLSFVALSSPTIGRFIDPGMVFMPAWVVATLASRWMPVALTNDG